LKFFSIVHDTYTVHSDRNRGRRPRRWQSAGGWVDERGIRSAGRSSRGADAPDSEPITTANVFGTILHALFDVPALRVRRGIPREIASLIAQAEPVSELV
jgi:hypothetical protein